MVDDDESIRRALKRLLNAFGYHVLTFGSAEEFLDHASERAEGCLILDIYLPGMNGFELQEELSLRGIKYPVLFMTGHDNPQWKERAVNVGAVAYLKKPFPEQNLFDAVELCLASYASREKAAQNTLVSDLKQDENYLYQRKELGMKKENGVLAMVVIFLFSVMVFAALPAMALETTGVPGSPSATTTISGKQLPPPAPPFGGVIKDDALNSKQWWPPRIVPPKDAPNILLIMTDDAGFAVPSTFGGVIPTPTMDRIANEGLRYNRIFSTSLCSPTRAALITGRNHHSVGFGVIAEQATGFPGYDSVIGVDNATIGRILLDNGYATSWFGKDHNTPSYQASQVGPFNQWPTGMGFEYFYGFVGGDANQWEPNLFRNTTQIYPFKGHEGTLKMDRSDPKAAIWPVSGKESTWNLVTAMADDAIDWMYRVHQTDPSKPIFLHYVPGASHAPHHPTKEWVDKIHAMHLFDDGYEKLRERIFENQQKLGVIPKNLKLTPWPDDILTPWDKLSDEAKKLYIRQVEVFAAFVAYNDHEIGRVIQAFEDLGKLDNTLIIYQNGDNGTSAEGGPEGTFSEVAFFNGVKPPVDVQMKFYDAWGTELAYNHMSAGWSWAFDTPFDWFKQNASRFGGTNQNMVIQWPKRIKDKGGLREQFMHDIDVVPTILEVTGIAAPEVVDGIKQKPIEGTSFAYTFDAENAKAPSRHKTQYFEMMGQWAIYHDGWLMSTKVDRAPWDAFSAANPDPLNNQVFQLYNLNESWNQSDDIAAQHPGEGQGNAGHVPQGSQEVSGLAAGCVGGRPGRGRASERHRGPQRAGLYAAHDRHPTGRCTLSARYLLHHHGGHHRPRGWR